MLKTTLKHMTFHFFPLLVAVRLATKYLEMADVAFSDTTIEYRVPGTRKLDSTFEYSNF